VADYTAVTVAVGLFSGSGVTAFVAFAGAARRRKKRPKLSLRVVEGLTPGRVDGHPVAFARLEVVNHPRSDDAAGVFVRIESVDADSSDHADKLLFLQHAHLAWANEDRGNPNVPAAPKPVNAGVPRRVDLAHLNASATREMIVDVRPQPANHLNYLGAGTFTFTLVVGVEAAPAARYRVELVHDGRLWDGLAASADQHLRVQNLLRL
jgi:hypothetical protein